MKVVKSSAEIITISNNENMVKISDSNSELSESDIDGKNNINDFEDFNANTEPNSDTYGRKER